MGEDNSFYTCKEPLKKDEIRTLRAGKPGDECDHTDYGPHSGNNTPDFNVLELYKQAHPHVVQLQVVSENKKGQQQFSTGSGFVVDGPDGHKRIITADHVVHNPKSAKIGEISVATAAREGLVAHVERFDPKTDLAVLRVDPKLERHLPAGLKLGQEDLTGPAIAIGHARGAEDAFVSPGKNDGMSTEAAVKKETGQKKIEGSNINPNMPLIRTLAHVEPGQSGGPLLNAKGEVEGVIHTTNSDDQAYSIPVSRVKTILNLQPIENAHLQKPGKPLDIHPQLGIDLRQGVPLPPHKPEYKAVVPLPPRRPKDIHDS